MRAQPLTLFYADDQEDLDFFRNPPPTPQIIFLDLNMPGRNGLDVLEEIKNTSGMKNIPVVVFSTSSDETMVNRTRALGADFYLPKLSSYDDFKKSIAFTLARDWNHFTTNAANFLYSA